LFWSVQNKVESDGGSAMTAKTIALALGGGGARGIAHVHVLRAFDDMGIKPVLVAGSSIGSLVGAGYASGMSGAEIEAYFLETFSNRTKVLSKLWKLRSNPISSLMPGNEAPFGQMDIEKVLEVFLPQSLPKTFDQLQIPLLVTGTDYYGNTLKVMSSGRLLPAIAASAAIPVMFKPVRVDGRILIDGGINNPLPFDLLDGNNHLTVAVDVVGLPRGDDTKLPGRIDAGFGASQLMMQSITELKLAKSPPDLFLRPNVDKYRVMDFLKVVEIVRTTKPIYDETRHGLEKLLRS
jgi:NTE family protein